MRYPLDLTGYLREWEAVFENDAVGALFADLIDQGYHLVTASELEDTFVIWWCMLRDMPEHLTRAEESLAREVVQPGCSAIVREEYAAFLARTSACMEFHAYSTTHVLSLHVLVQCAEGEPLVSIEVDDDYFSDAYGENPLQIYEYWIQSIKLFYRHLRPFYASFYDSAFWRSEDQTSREDALAARIHSLTLVNIFGPELVRQYGRERLLSTPLWRIDQLEDGALLLLPQPYGNDYVPAWRQAASHLGIPA